MRHSHLIPLLLSLVLACVALPAHAQSPRDIRNAAAAGRTADELIAKGNYDKAIAECTRAMKLEPNEAAWPFKRGQARALKKDFAGAIDDFSTAIGLRPDKADYYVERGFARFELGIISNATVDLDKAVALEPGNAARRQARARLYWFMGNLTAAVADLNATLRMDSSNVGAYQLRGVLREAQADFDGALADYVQAIKLSPNIYPQFRRFLVLRRKKQDGFADLARAVPQATDAWARSIGLYLIDNLSEQDLLARAAKGDAQTQRNQLSEAHYYIGMLYLIGGRTGQARDHFEKCVAQNVRNFLEDTLARAELQRLD